MTRVTDTSDTIEISVTRASTLGGRKFVLGPVRQAKYTRAKGCKDVTGKKEGREFTRTNASTSTTTKRKTSIESAFV